MRVAQWGAYDMPWLQGANDALWSGLASRLTASGIEGVPAALDRTRDVEEVWEAPDMLLAHTCGYPLVTQLAGRVRLVSMPLYATPFADDTGYRSVIIVPETSRATRLDDLRGSILGLNAWNSNSGMNLLRAALGPLAKGRPFFSDIRVTGAHMASLAGVAAGEIHVAAIDGVTMALTARHRPDLLRGVRVLGTTPGAPALPFITHINASDETVALMRTALDGLIADPSLAEARSLLGFTGFRHVCIDAYDRILDLERDAAAHGYPVLS